MQTTAGTASLFSLAWRQMARDFRAGELRLLAVAVLLAWRLAQRIGFLLPRRRAQHDKLLCVRPLDLDD